jgi:serine/threonine-protein kinase RsbW
MPPLRRLARPFQPRHACIPQAHATRAEPLTLMDKLQGQLELDSRLTELSRVQPWIEALADLHRFGEDTRFAIQLCMEEALANVVMHGYGNEPGHPIVIQSWVSNGALFFAIEDKAPPFTPSEPDMQNNVAKPGLESMTPGGNGIRLMRRFAGSLTYETISDSNRLTMSFPL